MKLNSKVLKLIRKYSDLRADNIQPAYNYKTFKKVYSGATWGQRRAYEREMRRYVRAVEAGKIKAGESLLLSVFSKGEGDLKP